MATYDEIRSAFADDALRKRIEVATIIAAQAELGADPGDANGRAWALSVFRSPDTWARAVMMSVLAANKDATLANILGASDATIQSAVDAAAANLAAAEAGA